MKPKRMKVWVVVNQKGEPVVESDFGSQLAVYGTRLTKNDALPGETVVRYELVPVEKKKESR